MYADWGFVFVIAAVDHAQKVVWGFGRDRNAAYQHAINVRAEKNKGLSWQCLEYCPLSDSADLAGSGVELYDFIVIPVPDCQIGFFD